MFLYNSVGSWASVLLKLKLKLQSNRDLATSLHTYINMRAYIYSNSQNK